VDHDRVVWQQAIGQVSQDSLEKVVMRMEDLTTGQVTTLATKAGVPTFQWPWVIWGQLTTGIYQYVNIKNLETGQQTQLQLKAAILALAGNSLAYDDINSVYLIDDITQTPLRPRQLLSASGSGHFQWVTLSDRLVGWLEDGITEVWDRAQNLHVRLPVSGHASLAWVSGHLLVWSEAAESDAQQQQDFAKQLIPFSTFLVVDTSSLPSKPVHG
jgi:hypothetical protein